MATAAVREWMPSDSSLVGARVEVTTTLGEQFTARVFSYDSACVTFEEESTPPKRSFRVLSSAFIASVTTLEQLSAAKLHEELSKPLTVDVQRVEALKAKSLRQAEAAAVRIGVGVSPLGQAIFDALAKTLPCKWKDQSIVVMDEILLSPPYSAGDCKLLHGGGSTPSLQRVKKVLEGERRKMRI